MALDEIRELLRFKDTPSADCGDVNKLLDAHIKHVAARVVELRAMEKELVGLRARCQTADAGANCAILKELDQVEAINGNAHQRNAVAHVGAIHGSRHRSAK